jgi:DNA invertase Pin-like site-specific DNA recombinase
MKAIAYLRVSTREQHDSGAGIAAQRTKIEAACRSRDWDLHRVVTEVASAKDLVGRPALKRLLDDLDDGEADVLIVSKLDRLSRSVLDFANLVVRAQKKGAKKAAWAVCVLDLGVDTSSPNGMFMAQVLAAMAEWERKIIGQRTKDALAEKRAADVRLGRPRLLPPAIQARIRDERADGRSPEAIAEALNQGGVPTAHGGAKWHPSTVRKVLAGLAQDAEVAV